MNCSACVCLLWRRSLCCLLSLSSAAPAGFELQLCRPGAAPAAGNVWSLLKRRGSVRTSSAGPTSQESWSLFPPCGTFHKRGPANRLHWYQGSVGGPGSGRKRPGGRQRRLSSALPRLPRPPPGLCGMLGSRLARCLCRWVSERAHPLRACSHGNRSDSEQLVFVFFGNVAAAGILTGTGEVWYAKLLPGRPYVRRMFSLWLSPVCCYIHAELCGHTASVELTLRFSRRWAMFIAWSLCFRARSTPRADRLNLFIGVHNPQVDLQIRFSQMTSG